jgi:hypothetical protein
VLPWFENRKKELANRPLIREQAFGEALDPDKLERLPLESFFPASRKPQPPRAAPAVSKIGPVLDHGPLISIAFL